MAPERTDTAPSSSKERLLAAADDLFYAEGIVATGVEALVARSGTARGSLYSHFGGKDGLVLAYLQAREDRWRTAWDAEVARHTDPASRVLAIFDAQARWQDAHVSDHGCAHAAAIAQLADGSSARTAAQAHKRATHSRLVELVGELIVETDEAQALAEDLLLIYEGALVGLSVGAVRDPIGRARHLADTLIRRHSSSDHV